MSQSFLQLKRDDAHSILFKSNLIVGVIFFIVGLGVCYFVHTKLGGEKDIWVAYVVGSVFTFIGFLIMLYKYEFEIYPTMGKYRLIKGMRPFAKEKQGPLSDIKNIEIQKTRRTSNSGKGSRTEYFTWDVRFIIENSKPVQFYISQDETKSRERFEHFAKKLKLKAIDRSQDGAPIEKDWSELDKKITEQSEAMENLESVDFHNPPEGMEVHHGSAGFRISLPALGFNAGTIFLGGFGAAFACAGLFAVLAMSGVFDVKTSGETAGLIVGMVFIFVGLGIMFLGIFGSYSQPRLTLHKGQIHTDQLFWGMEFFAKSVPIQEVEDITVRTDTSSRSQRRSGIKIGNTRIEKYHKVDRSGAFEMVIRSDKKKIVLGPHHRKEDLDWARLAILNSLKGRSSHIA